MTLTQTQDKLINKCYAYITQTANVQGRLLDCKLLFGDGSRFNNDYTTFEVVYNQIKHYLNSPNTNTL